MLPSHEYEYDVCYSYFYLSSCSFPLPPPAVVIIHLTCKSFKAASTPATTIEAHSLFELFETCRLFDFYNFSNSPPPTPSPTLNSNRLCRFTLIAIVGKGGAGECGLIIYVFMRVGNTFLLICHATRRRKNSPSEFKIKAQKHRHVRTCSHMQMQIAMIFVLPVRHTGRMRNQHRRQNVSKNRCIIYGALKNIEREKRIFSLLSLAS